MTTTMKQSTEKRDSESVPRRDRGGIKGVERNHVVVIEIQNVDNAYAHVQSTVYY